ncbi:MAG: peptidoglycan DD-metalloendopeptidase family protein [Bacteroidota bacterium]|nr:peptidoglycan DD-metalloendopeptidase family protein [Bacteroidota bacterium]
MRRLLLVTFCALAIGASSRAQTGDRERLESERAAISERIAATQSLLDATREDKDRSTQEWAVLKEQVDLRQQLLANLQAERHAAERALDRRKAGVREADDQVEALKEEYAEMIRIAARFGGRDDWWQVVLDAEGMTQAFRRWLLVEEYARNRKAQAERIHDSAESLRQEMTSLDRERQALVDVERDLQDQRDEAKRAARRMESMVADFQSRERDLRDQLAVEEGRRAELGKAIERIMAEARRAAERSSTGFAATPEGQVIGAEFTANKGRLPWPVSEGVVVGRFGTHPHPSLPGIRIERRGIDIATSEGGTVSAIFSGRVSNVITIPGGGMVVMLDHGSHRSVYANLGSVAVAAGEDVRTGQAIGTVIDLGEGPRAHLEIWDAKGSAPLNPEPWIAR